MPAEYFKRSGAPPPEQEASFRHQSPKSVCAKRNVQPEPVIPPINIRPREYQIERFPSPPREKPPLDEDFDQFEEYDARTSVKDSISLHPPMPLLQYPPGFPFDPTDAGWLEEMRDEVQRQRDHWKDQIMIARNEAAETMALVMLAQCELEAERKRMQQFIDSVEMVVGSEYLKKLLAEAERTEVGVEETGESKHGRSEEGPSETRGTDTKDSQTDGEKETTFSLRSRLSGIFHQASKLIF